MRNVLFADVFISYRHDLVRLTIQLNFHLKGEISQAFEEFYGSFYRRLTI